VVETGQRVIVNPVALAPDRFERTFHDAHDAASVIGAEVPLSTAVHMGARFTYVSPAGTIERRDLERTPEEPAWFRVVDGGYFENSGAVTLDEIRLAIQRQATHIDVVVRPIVIQVSNEPVKRPERIVKEAPGRRVWMGAVLSPVRALLHVRPARGYQARDELAERMRAGDAAQSGPHVHFRPCDYDVTLPLGWMLSGRAREDMTQQLVGYDSPQPPGPGREVNVHNLRRVVALVGGDLDPGSDKMQCW
jgi:hypothetical protein